MIQLEYYVHNFLLYTNNENNIGIKGNATGIALNKIKSTNP